MTHSAARTHRRSLLALALLLAALGAVARACDVDAAGRQVRVSVLVIHASETDDQVDPRLACIAREARRRFPRLKGFRMGKLSIKSLTVNRPDVFELPEGQKVCVTVKHVECTRNKTDRVCLKLGPPSMGVITYSTPCGKFLPILTSFRAKNGEVMLIAVRVQPCAGK
jgi:hypothetical protein